MTLEESLNLPESQVSSFMERRWPCLSHSGDDSAITYGRLFLTLGAQQNLRKTDHSLGTHQQSRLSRSSWEVLQISPQFPHTQGLCQNQEHGRHSLVIQTVILIRDIKLISAPTYQHLLYAKYLFKVVYYCVNNALNAHGNSLRS